MNINAWMVLDEKSDAKSLALKKGYEISKILVYNFLTEDEVYHSLTKQLNINELELRLLGLKLTGYKNYKLYKVQLTRISPLKKIISFFSSDSSEGSIILMS